MRPTYVLVQFWVMIKSDLTWTWTWEMLFACSSVGRQWKVNVCTRAVYFKTLWTAFVSTLAMLCLVGYFYKLELFPVPSCFWLVNFHVTVSSHFSLKQIFLDWSPHWTKSFLKHPEFFSFTVVKATVNTHIFRNCFVPLSWLCLTTKCYCRDLQRVSWTSWLSCSPTVQSETPSLYISELCSFNSFQFCTHTKNI